ncbi:MAG: hypothetical protein HOE83_00060 [Alphaproteobacteria bacterium]|jgi:hypothetical protein|nr:hypothetical protein [Alphaproteobacteria bacterium]
MGLKQKAITEFEGIMRDFDISSTRLSRTLFHNPSFYSRLIKPKSKITDVSLDIIFRHAVQLRGQREMTLIVGKKERKK